MQRYFISFAIFPSHLLNIPKGSPSRWQFTTGEQQLKSLTIKFCFYCGLHFQGMEIEVILVMSNSFSVHSLPQLLVVTTSEIKIKREIQQWEISQSKKYVAGYSSVLITMLSCVLTWMLSWTISLALWCIYGAFISAQISIILCVQIWCHKFS